MIAMPRSEQQEPKDRTPDRRNRGRTVARMNPDKDVRDDRHTSGKPETKQGELGQGGSAQRTKGS
jgi:hypothetical protein